MDNERLTKLERESTGINIITDRMEISLNKLIEVSSNISQLLAVQDKRLEMQERTLDRLQILVENRRQEVDNRFDKNNDVLSNTEIKFRRELTENQEKITKKLDELHDDHKEISEKFDKRLTVLEHWKWLLAGAGAVLGFFAKYLLFP